MNKDDLSGAGDGSNRITGRSTFVLYAKKLKSLRHVFVAAAHNLRETSSELASIAGQRTQLNEHLVGPNAAREVEALVRQTVRSAGHTRLRKDAVWAVEFLVTLHAAHSVEEGRFFRDALEWIGERSGGMCNVVCADIHRDEAAPHMHVLVVPLSGDRMRGSAMVGGKATIEARIRAFEQDVAARFGLMRPANGLRGKAKAAGADAVLRHLRETQDPAMRSKIWPQLRQSIVDRPATFMASLAIAPLPAAPKRRRTMTAIFTSPGRGKAIPERPTPSSKPVL